MCDPPPKMRGMFMKQAKRSVIETILIGITSAFLFRTFYIKPRHQRIEDYYK